MVSQPSRRTVRGAFVATAAVVAAALPAAPATAQPSAADALKKYNELYSYTWWAFNRVAGYSIVPMLIWKLIFRRRLYWPTSHARRDSGRLRCWRWRTAFPLWRVVLEDCRKWWRTARRGS